LGLVTVFDFLTFFLGLALTTLGEFFILAGGADSNFGLAIFSILIIIIGLGISYVREVTSENAQQERDIRRIYGFICFVCGMVFVIIPIARSAILLVAQPPRLSLGNAFLLAFTVVVGIVLLLLGYSWAGAFEIIDDEGVVEDTDDYVEAGDSYDNARFER